MTAASGLRMYSKAQAQDSQQMLIERHGPLVKRIAYHLLARLPANVQVEDLMQAGMIGLLEAAKKYDASKGASFETYAGIRIRGAMLDEVRKGDWAPRSVHRKMRQVSEAIREIEHRTGRDAKDADVAQQMGISLNDYHDIMRDSAAARVFSLDAEDEEHPLQIGSDEREPSSVLQEEGFEQALAKCIADLPEREQLVMSLYYNDELNLKEIGLVMEISESRVCQIHGQALIRIRARLSDWTLK
ncbi:MAG TPA: RNA polymerase sigma factor FliA [Gammaproteobacteria bacterium]|nr:RNA polymerase sigma factor FliA [Gammaproteobacteria bacterium]